MADPTLVNVMTQHARHYDTNRFQIRLKLTSAKREVIQHAQENKSPRRSGLKPDIGLE